MSDLTLFDAPPTEPLSADRRRTQRQAAAVARGQHPLSLVIGGIRVRPDADPDRTATPANTAARGLRCGTCLFRQQVGGYPKCVVFAPTYPNGAMADQHAPRYSRGASTDCRSWWPACTDWSPAAPAEATA